MSEVITWSPGVTLEAIEKMVILKAYAFFKKNKTATATALGIAIRTLDSKLEKYELENLAESERQAHERARKAELLNRARGNPPNNQGIPYSPGAQEAAIRNEAQGRLHVESSSQPAQKSEMPLSQRPEVQTVLPKQAPQSGKGKGR